jgi:thiamine-phosphate pyrophosphorylase
VIGTTRRTSLDVARQLAVYVVADPEQTRRDLVADVAAALAGGVTCVQLRAKRLTDREATELARRLRELCRRSGAWFLVNDRLDIALAVGADGVHLGVDDLPVAEARRVAGPEFVIGFSPESDQQTAEAAAAGADYLGVGPVYATGTKLDAGAPIGLETLCQRVSIAGIPVVGIGGITPETAADVIAAGAAGVAVVGAILRAPDPERAAALLRQAVDSAREERRHA